MTQQSEIKQNRQYAAKLFGSKCELCLKKFGKNFQFHHIGYRKGEKKHSDFKSYYEYTKYIIPIIFARPKDFALLCKTCHHLITILQAFNDDVRFERVVYLARRSRE